MCFKPSKALQKYSSLLKLLLQSNYQGGLGSIKKRYLRKYSINSSKGIVHTLLNHVFKSIKSKH